MNLIINTTTTRNRSSVVCGKVNELFYNVQWRRDYLTLFLIPTRVYNDLNMRKLRS